MIRVLPDLKQINANRKTKVLLPLIENNEKILDFGCGDLFMAHELWRANRTLTITGIDVVNFGNHYRLINFKRFDGENIPFPAKSFNVVISYHVFHHTSDPSKLFRQCCRVAKRRVIFVEPVYRSFLEFPGMIIMDWLFNIWKNKQISMTFNFHSKKWWIARIASNGLVLKKIKDVEVLPFWSPTGRSLLFVIDKT